jgi:streptogramin lyase
VADAVAGAVYRFDPVTHKVVQTVTLPGGADSIAAGEGGVWVADRAAGSVIRIDPSTGSTGSPIRVGSLPSAIATGAGAVWVADGGDGTVSRIDPVTYEVTTYRLTTPPSPFDIAVGEHGVWATLVGPAPGAHG